MAKGKEKGFVVKGASPSAEEKMSKVGAKKMKSGKKHEGRKKR